MHHTTKEAFFHSGIDCYTARERNIRFPVIEFLAVVTHQENLGDLPDVTACFEKQGVDSFALAATPKAFPCTIHGVLLLPQHIPFPESTNDISIERVRSFHDDIADWSPQDLPYVPLFLPEALAMVRITLYENPESIQSPLPWMKYFYPGFISQKKRRIAIPINGCDILENGQYRVTIPEPILSRNQDVGEAPCVLLGYNYTSCKLEDTECGQQYENCLTSLPTCTLTANGKVLYTRNKDYEVWVKPLQASKSPQKGFYLSVIFADGTKQSFFKEDCHEYQGYYCVYCNSCPTAYELYDPSTLTETSFSSSTITKDDLFTALTKHTEVEDAVNKFLIISKKIREYCAAYAMTTLGELLTRSAIPTHSDIETWLTKHPLGTLTKVRLQNTEPKVTSIDELVLHQGGYMSKKDPSLLKQALILDFTLDFWVDDVPDFIQDTLHRAIRESLMLYMDEMLPFWMLAVDAHTVKS